MRSVLGLRLGMTVHPVAYNTVTIDRSYSVGSPEHMDQHMNSRRETECRTGHLTKHRQNCDEGNGCFEDD